MIKGTISIENARIGFKNFAGAEGQYNRAGDRNFVVFLDREFAEKLEADGWNIKWPKPNEKLSEDQELERQPYLPVDASFGAIPPKIVMIPDHPDAVPTKLDESEVEMLDWANIIKTDLIIRPYNWEVNGNTGVKAYVKSLYATIETDEFQEKYGI